MTSRIVFIDSAVTDYQTLIPQLPADAEVVILNSTQDGIAQILAALQGKSAFDALDIISHGAPGALMLGASVVNGENLAQYAAQLEAIGNHLNENGDILLYGCEVAQGEQGQRFIEQLAQFTGADVAASEDLTGNAALGGDWALEKKAGAIETAAQFFNYQHLLSSVVPVGSEILVNTATQGDQYYSQIATLANGGFVITWEDESLGVGGATGDTSDSAIKAQMFHADGSKNGSEILVNSATNSWQSGPRILTLQNGGFVINWTDDSNGVGGAVGDFDSTAVKAQIFDSNGDRIGTEILVNTTTTDRQNQYLPDYSIDNSISLPNGNFIIVWNNWSGATRVKAQLFNPTGNKIGNEIDVSTYGNYNFDIAVLNDGKFVITSTDSTYTTSIDGSSSAIGAQIFNPDGSKYNDEILVNTATDSWQGNPEIVALQDGGFVIAWTDGSQGVGGATGDTSGTAIKAQVFNSDGSKLGNEILANTTTENLQELTQIAALPNGGFVIAWEDWNDNYQGSFKVKAQVFGPEGNKIGDEILVNTVTDNQQWGPRITALPNSDFVIFWQKEIAYDFSQSEATGQLFSATGTKIGDEFPVIDIQDFYPGSKVTEIKDIAILSDGKIVVSLDDGNPAGGGATAIDDASGSAVKAQIFQVIGAINHPPTGSVYINDTTPELCQTLTASNDLTDADGLGAITYQWYAGDTLLGTGDTYTVTTNEIGKTISVTASYIDGLGNSESVSSVTTNTVSLLKAKDIFLSVLNDDEQTIFGAEPVGVIRVMADFSKAAYHLESREDSQINNFSDFADSALAQIQENWQPVNLGFPIEAGTYQFIDHDGFNSEFPLTLQDGMSNGFYTRGNAAAFVARSEDAVVISFRGTNDYSGDDDTIHPDKDEWGAVFDGSGGDMNDHYELLEPLINAADQYVANNSISRVYVTGHSLGGAIAIEYMARHEGDDRYQAVTFAAPDFTKNNANRVSYEDDNRIRQIEISEDPVPLTWDFAFNQNRPGDVIRFAGDQTLDEPSYYGTYLANANYHSMDYYRQITDSIDAANWLRILNESKTGDQTVFLGGRQEGNNFIVDDGNNTLIDTVLDDDEIEIFYGGQGDDTLTGGKTKELLLGGSGNDTLKGNGGVDSLYGDAGNDTLNGGGGIDYLYGGPGNDIYIIDGTDIVNENFDEGIDKVNSNLSYALPDNVENLTLTGMLAINGSGNAAPNWIAGNAAANQLYGHGGNDTLSGGANMDALIGGIGDDTYIVDNTLDVITEYLGEGTDKVSSSATYTLSAHVENLTLTGTLAINGTGNDLNNNITGNSANNQLNGGSGNDTLNGGAGTDTLTGGIGKDVFRFTATGHIDTITDFSVIDDTIQLENSVFTALTTTGKLAADILRIGTHAMDSNDFVIYNNTTGAILYDADGSNANTAIQIASVSVGLSMTNADFVVI